MIEAIILLRVLFLKINDEISFDDVWKKRRDKSKQTIVSLIEK